ncbi:MAG TPA: hypothetical protein PKK10_14020 [Woeseiaceae bacterium]|nr:hypothetical protein [Woeseiaceae bacterium]
MSEARRNSVTQLAELYNVVIGIALSVAIYNLIDVSARPAPVNWGNLFGFAVLLVTIIPFYHGAVRHLYITYVEGGGSSRIKSGALLADFVLLFVEGCLFVALAILLVDPVVLVYGYISLLVLDSVWGFLAKLAFTGAAAQAAERKWAIINVVTVAVIFVLLAYVFEQGNGDFGFFAKMAIFSIALLRTIADYSWCWSFYYPPEVDVPNET